MENLETPSSSVKHNTRKSFTCISLKDLWAASGHGSVAEVDSALLLLKKTGGNIDSRNTSGVTPLHIAVWRNHVPIVMRLLAAGADPDARDGESGWSSLHRALHFGHFAVASVLMQAGASLTVEDSKCRIPVDLLSGPVSQVIGSNFSAVSTEVYSWGSGTNYQLGTGNAHIQKLPGKVDALHDSYIKIIGASKFHSIAVDSNGKLYTWGFGRGGRLGHSDFDIHSGQAAVITPRLVTSGLGSHRVKAVAAAKHHTVIATESGDVFTWGSNREGQLGYTSIDTQPTPRRVSYLRIRIDAVAAANKHTAAVAESGEVFTWGCNKEGQLGYGTSNSASNYTPRMVEYLKGKAFKKVSAAKNHTVVLSADGEVFTWGHRLVNPRRVIISRSLKKCGAALLKFHRTERLHVTSVSAGMTHSSALTEDGSLFYWSSSDPDLRCEQLNSLSGKNIVSISSGKYWTATVTTTGDVYMWDGKKCTHDTPIINRLPGIKHATSVCVGETHLLAVCGLFHPAFLPALDSNHQALITKDNDDIDALDEECLFSEKQPYISETVVQSKKEVFKFVPSLKSLCEKVAAEILVEPRNAIQVLEIADSLEAENLRKHCEDIVIRNFAYIFTVSAPAICSTSLDILARLENLLDAKSSEPWSYRRLPTATATFPVIIQCEVGGIEIGNPTPRGNRKYIPKNYGDLIGDSFLLRESEANQAVSKQVRTLRKKLQQIEMLVSKQHNGHALDDQQVEKIQSKSALEFAITELGFPLEAGPKLSFSRFSSGNANKKAETTKKHRQTSKNKITRAEISVALISEEDIPVKSLPNEKRYISNIKENMAVELSNEDRMVGDLSFKNPKANHDSSCSRPVRSTSIKKKNKKGGLSMFLNGALDDIPKVIPSPPPTPKCEGPAWGGVKIAKGPTSLRDIQNEQSKTKEAFIYPKENCEDSDDVIGVEQVRLGLYIPVAPSSPITVKPTQQVPVAEAEKSTSPWSSSRTSIYRPSLRNIQIQQGKKQQSSSHSPKSTSGFAVAPHGLPSEPGGPVPNRWFKPEAEAPSSIRSIQIEEKAMKDLRRFYSSVKLVRAQPEPL